MRRGAASYVTGRLPRLKIQPPIEHPAFCDCERCGALPQAERGSRHVYRLKRASPYPDDKVASMVYAREVQLAEEARLTVHGVPSAAALTRPRASVQRRKGQATVYVLWCGVTGFVKIGVTRDITSRVAEIQKHSPTQLILVGTFSGGEARERALHTRHSQYRLHGEWFALPQEALVALLADADAVHDCRKKTFESALSTPYYGDASTGATP